MVTANIVRALPSVYGPISKKFIREATMTDRTAFVSNRGMRREPQAASVAKRINLW
jgi:hypothetical protein